MNDLTKKPVIADGDPPRISTGSEGLYDILGGGFEADRLYPRESRPRTGKATLALRFPREGASKRETALKDFSGVFTGTPRYTGSRSPLLADNEPGAN